MKIPRFGSIGLGAHPVCIELVRHAVSQMTQRLERGKVPLPPRHKTPPARRTAIHFVDICRYAVPAGKGIGTEPVKTFVGFKKSLIGRLHHTPPQTFGWISVS